MVRRNGWVGVVVAFAIGCGGGQAAPVSKGTPAKPGATPVADSALAEVPPMDPQIRKGVLDNGLTYYVMRHRKPEQRAQLWLGVNTGSVMEDDDQQGLAHFVEHMAFNGTENFKKMAIVNYMESVGMKFGPDVNAYTSFDETVYMLQVPTDDKGTLHKGLDILREWAGRVSFEPEEVDKERGVVLEEWRLGRGAFMRILDKQYPVLFKGSKYASRLPIGKDHIIKKAPRDALVRFYKDWYRPDLMAVVAVGDFDVDAMEKQIVSRFSGMKKPASPRPRAVVDVPAHGGTLVTIETDAEMPRTSVSIYNKMPHRSERTVGDYRRILTEELYHSMLNARFQEIAEKPSSPFVFAGSSTSSFVRSSDVFGRSAMVKEGKLDAAISALFAEVLRVERHGFTESELERAKRQMRRGYQQSAKEKSKKHGRQFAAEILRNYFEDELMPGIDVELEIVEKILPGIALGELNSLAKNWGGEGNRVVMISGPEKMKKPSKDHVLALIGGVANRELAAYQDGTSDAPLMARAPAAGKVTAERTIDAIGVTEWTLSNGAKVVLKPTNFKNDEIQMQAFSPGGHSLVSDEDFATARFASNIVGRSGVGAFDNAQLRNYLKGRVARARSWISELEEGVDGSASPQDLETLLQLVHLRFTAPRKDPKAFDAWKAQELEFVRNRRLNPESAFFEDMGAFVSQGHLRRKPVTPEMLDEVDLDKALKIYSERFADASDFTFVFVGNIDLGTMKPLVETYLASLPARPRKESWKDVGVRPPRGVKTFEAKRGKEPKSFVFLTFHGPQKWGTDAANDIEMLSEVLRIRLREVLREDLSGVYGASVWGDISRRPRQERSFGVFFGCSPDNVEKLKKAVFSEIKAIQKSGIGDEYIAKVKATRTRSHEVELKENRFWAGELARAWRYGDDPKKILDYDKLIAKVSSKRVRAAAKKYLRGNQYVLGILRPES